MAFMKDEPSVYTGKRTSYNIPQATPLTPASMAIQTANPYDEKRLAAMRAAQRAALASYQKNVSPATTANPASSAIDYGNMGSANAVEHDLIMKKEAEAAKAAGAADANPLQDLVDQGIMTEDEAAAAAAKMFAPQLGYLDTLSAQAKGNAAASGKKIGDLYAAMQAGYGAEKTPTEALYNKANTDLQAIYGEGVASNNKNQQESAQKIAATMKNLGLRTEGMGPTFFDQGLAQAAQSNQRLNAESATQRAGNVNARTAAVQDLGVKSQAAGLMNADQQWALQMKLQDILGGYGMKKAELQGQQAAAAQDILAKSKSSYGDAMKTMLDQQQQAWENDYKMKQLGLEQQKLSQSGGAGGQKLSPIEEIAASAAEQYSAFNKERYGSSEAREATDNGLKAITDAASRWNSEQKGAPPASAQQFMDFVRGINPKAKDIRILMDLAQRYYGAAWGRGG